MIKGKADRYFNKTEMDIIILSKIYFFQAVTVSHKLKKKS